MLLRIGVLCFAECFTEDGMTVSTKSALVIERSYGALKRLKLGKDWSSSIGISQFA